MDKALFIVPIIWSSSDNPPKNRSELEKYYDICNPSFKTWRKTDSVENRADEIIEKLCKIAPKYNQIVIYTRSGGAFGLRFAISKMQFFKKEYSEVYNKITHILIIDGVVEGAVAPLALCYLHILYNNEGKPIDSENVENGKIGLPNGAADELTYKQVRESLYYWPHWKESWRDQSKVEEAIGMGAHKDRKKYIEKLKGWKRDSSWGEGIYKISFISGGNKLFNPSIRSRKEDFNRKYFLRAIRDRFLAYAVFELLKRSNSNGRRERKYKTIVDIYFYGYLLNSNSKHVKIKRLKLATASKVSIDPALAPGCIGEMQNDDIQRLKDGGMAIEVLYKKYCYIPTISSASIRGRKPLSWAIGKSKEEIIRASNFDEVYFKNKNLDNDYHKTNEWYSAAYKKLIEIGKV